MRAHPRRTKDTLPHLTRLQHPLVQALCLGVAMWLLCLFGIYSRPASDLAALWPANAFAMGMLVRFPQLTHRWSWLAIACAYLLADAFTGSHWEKNLLLNTGNLAAIATGYSIFRIADPRMHGLRNPMSVLLMLVAVVCAGLVSGIFGAISTPYLFSDTIGSAFTAWFGAEVVNATTFLPMILTLPQRAQLQLWRTLPADRSCWLHLLPAVSVVLSACLGSWIGGPGAIAFAVPALMWCAITYNLFTVAVLAFVVSTWSLLHVSLQLPVLPSGSLDRTMLLSARIGMSLVMLTPIMIGIVTATNRELVQRLRTLANVDQLTGIPTRRAFLETAQTHMEKLKHERLPCAVLMLDIDHFKRVNDAHGHATGDALLQHFGAVLRECLRSHDAVGRLGGEEFAVLLPNTSATEAHNVAERIRQRLLHHPITLEGSGKPLYCTVSVGLAAEEATTSPFNELLARADAGLYEAKAQGRNAVVQREAAMA